MKKHLIIYAKRPLPGYAKTRVGASLGMEASAGIYARLLYTYVFDIIHNLESSHSVELSVASPNDVAFFQLAFPELIVRPQVIGDLGFRMESSFQLAFDEGADCVVLTGSDIPNLSSHTVIQAFLLLERHQGVIGPASDGGYYLIGMRTPGTRLFHGITWSTDTVLAQTEERAIGQGLKLVHLPTLSDMDDAAEYAVWQKNISKN